MLMPSRIFHNSYPSVNWLVPSNYNALVPLLYWPDPIQSSKSQLKKKKIISYGKPSLVLSQQHQLLLSLGFHDAFCTP